MIPGGAPSVLAIGRENFPAFSAIARTGKEASNRIEMAYGSIEDDLFI
jgi:hypothetical protein